MGLIDFYPQEKPLSKMKAIFLISLSVFGIVCHAHPECDVDCRLSGLETNVHQLQDVNKNLEKQNRQLQNANDVLRAELADMKNLVAQNIKDISQNSDEMLAITTANAAKISENSKSIAESKVDY